MQPYSTRRSTHKTRCIGLKDEELFRIFCVLGALSQVSYVLDTYFKYDFLTRAYVGVPEITVFPDVTVCFDTVYMINYTQLFEKYPKIARTYGFSPGTRVTLAQRETLFRRYTPNGLLYHLGGQLTIREVWEVIYPRGQVIESAQVRRLINRKTVHDPCKIEDIFSQYSYCYVFACSFNAPVIAPGRDLYREVLPPSIFKLKLKQNFFKTNKRYDITLTPPNTLPRGQRIKWESQNAFQDPRNHKFSFYSLEVDYLPAPYPSDCRNYTAEGEWSQIVMKDKCQIRLALEKIGSPLPGSLIDRPLDTPFGFVVFEANQANATFISIVDGIVKYCNKITRQPDCVYKAFMISSRNPTPISGNFTQIAMDHIRDPVSVVTLEPRMSFLDCLIMIGSVLGTWLGFSVAYHVPKVSIFCYQKICKCCCEGHAARNKSHYPGNIDPKIISLSRYDDESMKPHRFRDHYHEWKVRKLPANRLPFYMYYDTASGIKNQASRNYYNVKGYSLW